MLLCMHKSFQNTGGEELVICYTTITCDKDSELIQQITVDDCCSTYDGVAYEYSKGCESCPVGK